MPSTLGQEKLPQGNKTITVFLLSKGALSTTWFFSSIFRFSAHLVPLNMGKLVFMTSSYVGRDMHYYEIAQSAHP